MTLIPDLKPFPSIARMSRECIVTEKIDGTNAGVWIPEEGIPVACSRTRWITPDDDNLGWAAWVRDNADMLCKLGAGMHWGEWWGEKIQRGYGVQGRRWSMFNAVRWAIHGTEPQRIPQSDPRAVRIQDVLPAGLGTVPVLYRGVFSTEAVDACLKDLEENGSKAAPLWMKPEGLVVFHINGNVGFKKTLGGDGHKGKC